MSKPEEIKDNQPFKRHKEEGGNRLNKPLRELDGLTESSKENQYDDTYA